MPTPAADLLAAHDALYAAGRISPFEHAPVTDRLRAGRNPLSEIDVLELVEFGITHVLDLREESEWAAPGRVGRDAVEAMARHGLARTHIPLRDTAAPTGERLTEAVTFVTATLADPAARLYLHCRAGIERTGTVLLAWYALSSNLSPTEAAAALRRQYARFRPLPHQHQAVEQWLRRQRRPGSR